MEGEYKQIQEGFVIGAMPWRLNDKSLTAAIFVFEYENPTWDKKYGIRVLDIYIIHIAFRPEPAGRGSSPQ